MTKRAQICGYDGHEEIELALLKLYGITQNPLHLRLARFFLDQHGKQPHFFELECDKRDEPVEQRKYRDDTQGMYAYYQAHQPVRQQRRAVGHAVRAMYLYCAMQDMVNLYRRDFLGGGLFGTVEQHCHKATVYNRGHWPQPSWRAFYIRL